MSFVKDMFREFGFAFCLPTVNCPSQETEVTSTPTRPADNVVITTKGLQDRNIHIFDGPTLENKGKLIPFIFPFTRFIYCYVNRLNDRFGQVDEITGPTR